jgi:hypothetical protein
MLESFLGCYPFLRVIDKYSLQQVEELFVEICVRRYGFLRRPSATISGRIICGGKNAYVKLLHCLYIFS